MSQNHSQHESQRTGHRLPSRGDLVAPITAIVREQQPLETDLTGAVLAGVAIQVDELSMPDVLELRPQLTVDVNEALPLVERVATIISAILGEVEHWKRGAVE